MAITYSEALKVYLMLSTDDKTSLEQEANIVFYSDTGVYQIYKDGTWYDYQLPS